MPLVGTAGHVDHGKSTLIQRLTGRDPDRWAEEKRRGLTIDLGFAWATLPDGAEVSFVDVPGHERYLKNMLAGIEAIDVALFVVAADEGWMPQSEEHLAVLDLLEVDTGVVALTKSDLAGQDLVELAAAEVSEKLDGTSLAGAPVMPVSGVTGEGVDALVEALAEAVASVEVADLGRPRLWVDRSFSIAGAGTVVTGTLLDGPLAVGDPVEIYPTGAKARIRGVQSHEKTLDRVAPGYRVALNLGGIDRTEVARGDMVGLAGQWRTTRRWSAELRPARYVTRLEARGSYQAHLGSGAHRAEIVALEEGVAVIRADRPVPLAALDRFIVRDTGRKLVVAGGRVLDPQPGRTAEALAAAGAIGEASDGDALASALLAIRGSDTVSRLAAHTRGGRADGAVAGDTVLSAGRLAALVQAATAMVAAEHQQHPLRVGLPLATLAERLDITQEVAEMVVSEAPTLARVGPDVTLEGREVALGQAAEEQWEGMRAALAEGLAVPTLGELGADPELVHLKVRTGELVRIGPDLVILPEQADEVRRVLAFMPAGFTVADFRDAIGLSRKYAVPLLEWADDEGLTVRRGDSRTVR